MPFTPALRGDAINNFDFVKRIHNSFARRMDMLHSDLQLKDEATSRKSRSGKPSHDDGEANAAFHFIAFVPAQGKVWKFDGLERQPQALGSSTVGNDWLDLVRDNILTRMYEYEEDQIEFSILSLARDPLLDLVDKLAINVKSLDILQRHMTLSGGCSGQTAFLDPGLENTIWGADKSLGLNQDQIDQAQVPAEESSRYQNCSVEDALQYQTHLAHGQQELRAAIREEQQSHRADDEYATGRRYDYGPAVRTWVQFLARKRILEELK
ncbi:hypothetical protein FE257_010501 [Aspergillus nanangensis]|uniref:ubiquitinyl hydrolase 1 n=1 Tax=Aspergillus nanangensis TaxID=2582783 RepID=A0AAD4GS15_ASPNN|nr:hypothetical protein FE257_010501 [Aspergillus nanangensis]